MSELDKRIARLRTMAEKLNEASDTASVVINDYEAKLEATGIGLEFWLEEILDREHIRKGTVSSQRFPADLYRGYQAGFGRVGKQWQLAYRPVEETEWLEYFPSDEPEGGAVEITCRRIESDGPAQPLANAPRSIRVQSVPLVDKIVEGLLRKASSLLVAVQTATGDSGGS